MRLGQILEEWDAEGEVLMGQDVGAGAERAGWANAAPL